MATRMMVWALASWMALPALAEPLSDPTAPPSTVSAEQSEDRPTGALTAIKLSRKQKIAVIDGQEVSVGSRYLDARVVRISENEVVLRRGRETTVLKLYPHVEKKLRSK